jgi:hypothetical protein
MTKPLEFYHTRGMQRTSQNLKEDVVKNDFGVRAQPLVSIEPEHIIIDQIFGNYRKGQHDKEYASP